MKKLNVAVEEVLKEDNISLPSLFKYIKNLSDLFQKNNDPNAYMTDKNLRYAYLSYFYQINVLKYLHILNFYDGIFPVTASFLDYGAGPLSFITACALKNQPGQAFYGYDKNAEILILGERVVSKISNSYAKKLFLQLPEKPVNVTVLGNVLIEQEKSKIPKLLYKIMGNLDKNENFLVILEPGTRSGFDNIMIAKKFIKNNNFKILTPCGDLFCPMTGKDWCHENLYYSQEESVKIIERKTGLNNRFVNFSYLIASSSYTGFFLKIDDNIFKVVSNPLKRKGEHAFYFCGSKGLNLFSLLSKNVTDRNSDFVKLRRGDIVEIRNYDSFSAGYRLNKGSVVKIIKKFYCE